MDVGLSVAPPVWRLLTPPSGTPTDASGAPAAAPVLAASCGVCGGAAAAAAATNITFSWSTVAEEEGGGEGRARNARGGARHEAEKEPTLIESKH